MRSTVFSSGKTQEAGLDFLTHRNKNQKNYYHCYFLQVYPYSSITKIYEFLGNFADMIIIGIYLKLRDQTRDTVTNERQLRVIASSH